MKKKIPWLAGLLNFLVPGVGFLYLAEPFYIVVGIVVLLGVLMRSIGGGFRLLATSVGFFRMAHLGQLWTGAFWPTLAVILAVLGYIGAKQINQEHKGT